MKTEIIDNEKINHLAFISILDAGLLGNVDGESLEYDNWVSLGRKFYFIKKGEDMYAVMAHTDSRLVPIETLASFSVKAIVLDEIKNSEKEFVDEIIKKIKDTCQTSHYTNLCRKISTEAGLANVANRSIQMMAKENMHLSATLAVLETELEGMD